MVKSDLITKLRTILIERFDMDESNFQLNRPIEKVCPTLNYLSDLLELERIIWHELGIRISLISKINVSVHTFHNIVNLMLQRMR